MSVERQITQASIGLLLEYPFFGHLLSELVKEVDADATTSLSIRYEEPVYIISVNPDFWENQVRSRQEQMGHLYHQLLHLFWGHLWRAADLPEPFLADVAADLQVNRYIPEAWLWEGALRAEDLPGLDLAPTASFADYYEAAGRLWRSEGGARDRLAVWYAERDSLFEAHRPWYRDPGDRRGAQALARWSARSLLKQAEQGAGPAAAGQLPGAMQRVLEEGWEKRETEINWRKLLRQFAQSSRSTWLKATVHRPSKRYGTRPGLRVRRRQRLLVAVDTSGSVSREEQRAFFGEIRQLARTGAEVTLLEFDAEIQRVYPFRRALPQFVVGGGGTNFVPVLEYANTGGPWDGVVIFTDGFAPIPRLGLRIPLLWVITAQGLSPATTLYRDLPGMKLKLRAGIQKSATLGS